jgi:hypothetical protein
MAGVPRPRVDVDLAPLFAAESRGRSTKELVVCHETISSDSAGTRDIVGPALYMDQSGLEVHGVIDADGNSGWAGDAKAVFDHAGSRGSKGNGRVNTRSVGFELVSRIPLEPSRLRYRLWLKRRRQLDKLAHWVAWLHQEQNIPLRYSDASVPGITTHWDVSRTYGVPHGHWDCWPKHKGGHFPVLYVVQKARNIVADYANA